MSNTIQQNGQGVKAQPNGQFKSKNQKPRKRDFLLTKHGMVHFRDLVTCDDIPAGEYYPLVRRDEAYLYPIVRHASYHPQPVSEEDELVELFDLLNNGEEDTWESPMDDDMDEPAFVPVHKYFPIEEWNPGLQEADRNVKTFLERKDFYRQNQMDYRRSILLHGDPGTGKSQYLFHLSKQLIEEHDAIVIRIEGSGHLSAFEERIQLHLANRPNRLKVVIIEELADFTRGRYATEILGLLDSMHFRENVMFLITTNFPERIPQNMVDRPSRLDLLSGVYTRDYGREFTRKWYEFIMDEPMPEEQEHSDWFRETPGQLSPAYLKELFVYSRLNDVDMDEAWRLIKQRKRKIKDQFNDSNEKTLGFDLDDDLFT